MENQEVLNLVLAKLEEMENRFDKMEAKVNSLEVTVKEIQEDTKITRSAVNALIEWAENVSVIIQTLNCLLKKQNKAFNHCLKDTSYKLHLNW